MRQRVFAAGLAFDRGQHPQGRRSQYKHNSNDEHDALSFFHFTIFLRRSIARAL